jgi:hypothetical protein
MFSKCFIPIKKRNNNNKFVYFKYFADDGKRYNEENEGNELKDLLLK